MTVIALIGYRDGVLLVADSRETHSILGIVDTGYTHTQKLTKLTDDIITAEAGGDILISRVKYALKSETAGIARNGLTDTMANKLTDAIKKEIGYDDEAMPIMIRSMGGAILLGMVKLRNGTVQPFRIEVMPSTGITVKKLDSDACSSAGVIGTDEEFAHLMKVYSYNPATASELDAEALGYKLIKRMEKTKEMGVNVGDPVEFCAVRHDGSMRAFMVDTKDAFKKDASGKDDWGNKDEMAKLKLAVDQEREMEIKAAAAEHNRVVDRLLEFLRLKPTGEKSGKGTGEKEQRGGEGAENRRHSTEEE